MKPEKLHDAGFREVAGTWLLAPMSLCPEQAARLSESEVLGAAEQALLTALRRVMSRRAELEVRSKRMAATLRTAPAPLVIKAFVDNLVSLNAPGVFTSQPIDLGGPKTPDDPIEPHAPEKEMP